MIQDIYRSKFFVHLNRAISRADNDDIQSSRGGVEIGGAMIKRAAERRHARWKGAEPLKRASLGREPEVAPGPRETFSAASSPSLAADAARVSPPSHEPHPFELASSFGASRFGRGMMDGALPCASEKTAGFLPAGNDRPELGRGVCIALTPRPLSHNTQGACVS